MPFRHFAVDRWRYARLHIPTGTKTEAQVESHMTRVAFLEWLNSWNRQQPGRWQYWAI